MMAYLAADNQGNDYSGHNRLLTGGVLNNLTGWEINYGRI